MVAFALFHGSAWILRGVAVQAGPPGAGDVPDEDGRLDERPADPKERLGRGDTQHPDRDGDGTKSLLAAKKASAPVRR